MTDPNCRAGETSNKRHAWLASRPWRRPDHPWHAGYTAEHCGVCGRPIAAGDPVSWTQQFGAWRSTLTCVHCVRPLPTSHPRPCVGCQRPVHDHRCRAQRSTRPYCCQRCLWTYYNRRHAERRQAERQKVCPVCHSTFEATRRHATTCSPACRTRRYRTSRVTREERINDRHPLP